MPRQHRDFDRDRGQEDARAACLSALPAGRQHTRDKLADLLWSDREDKQARASLRQALGELRRGFEAVAGRRSHSTMTKWRSTRR